MERRSNVLALLMQDHLEGKQYLGTYFYNEQAFAAPKRLSKSSAASTDAKTCILLPPFALTLVFKPAGWLAIREKLKELQEKQRNPQRDHGRDKWDSPQGLGFPPCCVCPAL